MRCYICDREIDDPQWSADHEDWEPCVPCQSVIQDTIDGYKDTPFANEDDLPDEDISEQYEGLRRYLSDEDDDFS